MYKVRPEAGSVDIFLPGQGGSPSSLSSFHTHSISPPSSARSHSRSHSPVNAMATISSNFIITPSNDAEPRIFVKIGTAYSTRKKLSPTKAVAMEHARFFEEKNGSPHKEILRVSRDKVVIDSRKDVGLMLAYLCACQSLWIELRYSFLPFFPPPSTLLLPLISNGSSPHLHWSLFSAPFSSIGSLFVLSFVRFLTCFDAVGAKSWWTSRRRCSAERS